MILAHNDSRGNAWYFRFDADRATVARIARKLVHRAVRVNSAKNNAALSRALLAEAVTIADLQAYNGATADDFAEAPNDERFIL